MFCLKGWLINRLVSFHLRRGLVRSDLLLRPFFLLSGRPCTCRINIMLVLIGSHLLGHFNRSSSNHIS